MVQLLPGVSAKNAIDLVNAARREAENLLGRGSSGVEYLNEYRDWASTQARMLSGTLSVTTLERVLLTHLYWMLQQLNPEVHGPSLNSAVNLGLTDTLRRLGEAAESLKARHQEWSVWGFQGSDTAVPNAVVLDTNVLLRHSHHLDEVQWHLGLNVFPHQPITLGIPITVVEELDGLKSSNAPMYIGDEKHAVRTLARKALGELDSLFPQNWRTSEIRQASNEGERQFGRRTAVLMIEDLDHVRLGDVDAEIIDRARDLTSYARNVAVASYDNALLFRARKEGLIAFKPDED